MELEVHSVIDDRFVKFDEIFEEAGQELKKAEDQNRVVQLRVGDMLDNYMTEIEHDSEYIAFDILDSNVENELSVEGLYKQLEQSIEQMTDLFEYTELQPLEQEYDRIYVWFDKNYEERIKNITQVVDRENPLQIE